MSNKEPTAKVLGWNIGILLFYIIMFVLFGRDSSGEERFVGGAMMPLFAIALHVGVDILVGFVFLFKKEGALGQAFLLSAGIILVIGFSVCMGGL